jgi:hypothetical protein
MIYDMRIATGTPTSLEIKNLVSGAANFVRKTAGFTHYDPIEDTETMWIRR